MLLKLYSNNTMWGHSKPQKAKIDFKKIMCRETHRERRKWRWDKRERKKSKLIPKFSA